jgi:DnaJ-class molecular chaperone
MNEPKTDWGYIDPQDPKGYYAYFGVSPSAEPSQVTEAYIKVIRECAGNEFVLSEAAKAYSVLSNPKKRREYDTQHGTSLSQSTPKKKDKEFSNEDGISQPNFHSGRTMGMPIDYNDSKMDNTKSSSNSDGCTGCIIIFVILLIISGVINLFKLISG